MTMKLPTRILCVLLLCSAFHERSEAVGGGRTNIRGLGMAGSSVASARWTDAVGVNPANLAFREAGTLSVSIVPIGVLVGSDFLTYGLYNDYLTGIRTDSGRVARNLTEADKRSILSSFSGGEGMVFGDAVSRPLGLSLQLTTHTALAFTVTERVAGHGTIPAEYAEFLFYGNTPGSVYDFSGSQGSAAWTREYALSVGFPLPDFGFAQSFYAGASLKLVHGFGYYELVRFDAHLATSPYGVLDGTVDMFARSAAVDGMDAQGSFSYDPFPAPAGTGIGIDLGAAAELGEGITAGMSVTDIGAISWKRNLAEVSSTGLIHFDDPLSEAQRDSVMDRVHGTKGEGRPFSTSLPTTLHLGVAVQLDRLPAFRQWLPGPVLIEANYHQGLVNAVGASKAPKVTLGLELRFLSFLPLRLGTSFGGYDRSKFTIGLGLQTGPFDLDLASENLDWLISPRTFSYGSLALGLRFRI